MNKLLKICLWAVALTPFIFDGLALLPVGTVGILFARFLIATASIIFTINLLSNQNFRNQILFKLKFFINNPIVIFVSSFVLIYVLSTITALNKYDAFWGTIDRGGRLGGDDVSTRCFLYKLVGVSEKRLEYIFQS